MGLEGKTASSVVFAKEKDRREDLISDTMVRFAVSGYGPLFVFDCAEISADGEAPVYEIPGNGVANGKDRIADSFGDFLLAEVNSLLESMHSDGEIGELTTSGKRIDEKMSYWKSRAEDFDI